MFYNKRSCRKHSQWNTKRQLWWKGEFSHESPSIKVIPNAVHIRGVSWKRQGNNSPGIIVFSIFYQLPVFRYASFLMVWFKDVLDVYLKPVQSRRLHATYISKTSSLHAPVPFTMAPPKTSMIQYWSGIDKNVNRDTCTCQSKQDSSTGRARQRYRNSCEHRLPRRVRHGEVTGRW